MLRARTMGYDTVLSVHDELVAEAPDDEGYSAAGLSMAMTMGLEWAPGLPLQAAGFEAYRYRKD